MELLRNEGDFSDVRVSHDELLIINNVLNEVCNGIDIPEFETRVGVEKETVQALLRRVCQIIDAFEQASK